MQNTKIDIVKTLSERILQGDKVALSRAITYLESTQQKHNFLAKEILNTVILKTGNSVRIGVTGSPGVGKSTFIEALGKQLLKEGKKIAVLAIDPSSQQSKGSILGDKTRMEELSSSEDVFIRPSPAGAELGGVNRKTRETILLCEACGFDTILIETVGVGQSEIKVHSMVDCLLLLLLPGAGDELQGIKRGIMEMVDIVLVNKVKDEKNKLANKTIANYKTALHFLPMKESGWIPKVVSCDSIENYNIESVWSTIKEYENHSKTKNYWEHKRKEQTVFWLHEYIQQKLHNSFYQNIDVKQSLPIIEKDVLSGKISLANAVEKLMNKSNLK